jgi:uncharacterized SAM-binding protein YcdF (DUF218 family)
MFLLKKIVAPLFLPLPICVLLLGVGTGLLWFTRRQRAGRILVTTAFALLVVLSYGWVSDPALRSLEHYHTPLSAVAAGTAMKWVVVLGGGTSSDPSIPLTARLSDATLARLVEGVSLHRQMPGSRLVLSGAVKSGSETESMSAVALALGVAREDIVVDAESPDTQTQARNIRKIVKGEPCVLVTSAAHMRRAMALFRKVGLDPIPAPTHYLARANTGLSAADFYPSIGGLMTAQIAAYEYLAIAWAALRKEI